MTIDPRSYYLLSLGCSKNTVDSESMSALIEKSGYRPVVQPSQAGILIVNTCGFIEEARKESLQALNDLARKKLKGQILIAAGCLPERYRKDLSRQVPSLDGILSTRRWMDIVDMFGRIQADRSGDGPVYNIPDNVSIGTDERGVVRAAIQGKSSYLKIADGCRRPCAFCSIPIIKGTTVSRPMETILSEALLLQIQGVKEINLIAQDTTDYGHDLGMRDGLSTLLEEMTIRVPDLPWIRVLYAFPGYVTDHLIQTFSSHPQILPYLDMPLQHAHPDTLKRMRRPTNMGWVKNTLSRMRGLIPDLALRTTFIVGYPGETEREFQTLLDFVEETKFDHVGVFTFSFEPGTSSEPLGDPIPEEIKEERRERLMLLQEGISLSINQNFVGKTLPVLIEGYNDGISIGRSYRDAPEIDGLVLVEGKASLGEFAKVQITGALTYDLTGRLLSD